MSTEGPGARKATDAAVIVLAFIVERPHPAGGPPDRAGRYRSTVAAMPRRRPAEHHSIGESDLTDRERAVAALAGQALTNQQIANRLGISTHTVNFHLRQIFRKLRIESRVQLARLVPERPP